MGWWEFTLLCGCPWSRWWGEPVGWGFSACRGTAPAGEVISGRNEGRPCRENAGVQCRGKEKIHGWSTGMAPTHRPSPWRPESDETTVQDPPRAPLVQTLYIYAYTENSRIHHRLLHPLLAFHERLLRLEGHVVTVFFSWRWYIIKDAPTCTVFPGVILKYLTTRWLSPWNEIWVVNML